jgi:HK97 family phage major capsid protein
MVAIAEKRQKAAQLANEIKKLGSEFQQRQSAQEKDPSVNLWPDETRSAWDRVNTEYDALVDQINNEESSAAINERMAKVTEDQKRSTRHGRQMPGLDDTMPGESRTYGDAGFDRDEAKKYAQREDDKRLAFQSYLVRHAAPHLITEKHRDACHRLGFSPDQQNINVPLMDTESLKYLRSQARRTNAIRDIEVRKMNKPTTGAGPELVPQTFLATFELAMLATSPMFAFTDTITTASGEDMLFPVGNDTAVTGVLVTEGNDLSSDTQTDPVLERLTLRAYDYSSRFIRVSQQLQRDAIVDVDQIVATLLGERLGRITMQHATVGTGSSQPQGVVTGSAAGVTAASATAIAVSDVIRLQHSVDPMYRGNGVFMCHDLITQAVRLLNDTTGRPLWMSGIREGIPDTLLGQPLIYNQYMASTIATTNITMLYGDLSYQKVRRVGSMRLIRAQERFIEFLETGFLGYMGFDSRLARWTAAAQCPVKRLTQA